MKEFIKNAKNWLTIWFFASVIIIVSLIIYTKARQSSSSGLTIDNSSPAALYVNSNETLTAAKRNRLVQKSNREEVATSDTALFDADCDRKFANVTNGNISLITRINADWSQLTFLRYNWLRYIDKWNKSILYQWSTNIDLLKLRKKCQ